MRFLTSSLLPLLTALSVAFVCCHPLAGPTTGLEQRAEGYVPSLPARNALVSPAGVELEGRQVAEIIEIAGAVISLIGVIEQAVSDDKVVRVLVDGTRPAWGFTDIAPG